MAILKSKEIAKMPEKERQNKLRELRMELIRANVSANKTNAKTKEIKKAISRLLTMETNKLNASKKEVLKK
jgi:ribosomal protein L29